MWAVQVGGHYADNIRLREDEHEDVDILAFLVGFIPFCVGTEWIRIESFE